ncbi:MAG: metallophosphoesterase [Sedimentisphaerales bacterium]|nr:metallophosphoesterase [Sedimentisphaerales bacterium]
MVTDTKIARKVRHWHGVALGKMGFCTAMAVARHEQDPEWLDTVDIDLQIPNLPAPLHGTRIIHLSDFHFSRTVSARFLNRCIERVNTLEPDIILLTGDYITHDTFGRFRRRLFEMLGNLQSRHGVYACLGNHDYGMNGPQGAQCDYRAAGIVNGLASQGIVVLRNQACPVSIEDSDLWLVGLGDLWAGDMHPDRAFAAVPEKAPAIVLAHNPRAVDFLHDYSYAVAVSGHTHGRQIKWASSPSGRLTIKNRQFHAGLYDLGRSKLYVNRGLGRLGSLSFCAAPEITVLTL